ncbi:MAG TPA: HEAT repeat domain-containing protein [Edaphobacter sp.]
MKCEAVRDHIILAYYGELPDELAVPLEQHIAECEECSHELSAMRLLDERMAYQPVIEPEPNFLAQSRMRLDEALDTLPPHGFFARVRVNFFRWVGTVQHAPALATMLLGVGFLGGNFLNRYEVAHQPKPHTGPIYINPAQSVVGNVTEIVQTPNSELVQVRYNRIVPETMEGSLDSPEIRALLLKGTTAPTDGIRSQTVSLLASECKAGHSCTATDDGKGIRNALLVSLRYDKDPGVRLKALEGLEPYVGQDQRVRDAVLEALARDPNAQVRVAAIGLLEPVHQDSSVRQVLRTVSTQDENPYIRTVSYNALQGAGSIQ